MNKILYVLLAILIISCKSNESEQEIYPNYTGNEIWDTLDINETTLNNMNIVTTIDSLLKYFGEPDSVWEKGGSLGKVEDGKTYKSYFYNRLKFAVWEDQVRLNGIDFQNSEYEIHTPKGIFSKETSEKELKKKFKNSFSWKNLGISRYQSGSMGTVPNEIDWDNTDWFYLDNGKENSRGVVEVVVINKKLSFIFIDNIE